ncbi:MAG: FAD-dependent oxidoreductase [Dehalococcoidales bacterium]
MKTKKADVVVVGAGVIGGAAAYFLSKAGLKVIVVERDSIGAHASGFAPGILNPLGESPEYMETRLPLSIKSFQMHKELAGQLPAESGIDYHFRKSTMLMLAFTQAEAKELKGRIDRLQRQEFNIRWLDSGAVHLIESRISDEIEGAAYLEDVAEVDSYGYSLALAQAAEKYGAEIRYGQFTGLKSRGNRVTAVPLASGEITCDFAVMAMGPWTGMASTSLGISIPVGPQKGETLRIKAPGPPFTGLLAWNNNYNTTTRHDGLVYHGATHTDAGFNEETTAEGRDELLNNLITMVPSLTEAEVVLQTACLRPLSTDGLPIIGEVPGWNGVYIASGHWKKGILLSPITGSVIAELITKGNTSTQIDPFGLSRFTVG